MSYPEESVRFRFIRGDETQHQYHDELDRWVDAESRRVGRPLRAVYGHLAEICRRCGSHINERVCDQRGVHFRCGDCFSRTKDCTSWDAALLEWNNNQMSATGDSSHG